MHTLATVNPDEFRRTLTPQVVLSFLLEQGAILMGVLMFAAAVFPIASATSSPPDPEPSGTINLVPIIHGFVAAICYPLFKMLYDRQFQTDKNDFSAYTEPASPPAEGVIHWRSLIRKATILRLALIESPAIFGLTICLIAAINGVLHEHPAYWSNGLSTLILILFIISSFPNSDRLMAVFDEKIRAL